MQKIVSLLLGTILLSGLAMGQAEARKNEKYSIVSKGSEKSVRGSHGNSQKTYKDHKQGKSHGTKNRKVTGKSKAHASKQGSRVKYRHQPSKNKKPVDHYKPPARKYVYKAAPLPKFKHKGSYVRAVKKPYYAKHYHYRYKPRYVYVKPHHTPRYYGYYPYRGYYWPFVNVAFVVNLSPRQIEHHHQAVYSALDKPVGTVTRWQDGSRSGSIVVMRDGFDENGNLCKEYRQTLKYHGHVSSSVEVSCLSPEGYWISV